MTSERETALLFEQYNPNRIRVGDRVTVRLNGKYSARVVGLTLDIKNKKVHADLKLLDVPPGKLVPTRVDVADCCSTKNLYCGHHNNG